MTFRPITPLSGINGWLYLKRTKSRQIAIFRRSPEIARNIAHFRQKIGAVKSADDLVGDRQLLKVALGAFGLDADIDHKFFVRKVLSEGTRNRTAFANRLTDKRYAEMAYAFGFGPGSTPRTGAPSFADRIINAYVEHAFEVAVGENDNTLRLAMNFSRQMPPLAQSPGTTNTGWYRVLGSRPLREVFQTALHLPAAFAGLPLDQQISTIKTRMMSLFGSNSISVFRDPHNLEKLLNQFLAAQSSVAASGATTPASAALTLLQQSNSGLSDSASLESIIGALY